MATKRKTTPVKKDEQTAAAGAKEVQQTDGEQAKASVVPQPSVSDGADDESAPEVPVEKPAKEPTVEPASKVDKTDSPDSREEKLNVLEHPPAALEVVREPEELPPAPGLTLTDVKEQRRRLDKNPALEKRVNSDSQTLGAILQIIHSKLGPILRSQKITSVPASNLEALQRYITRGRVTSGTNVNFQFPTVNIIVETEGAEANKRKVVDGFVYNDSNLSEDPIATVYAKLVFYEGDKLKVKTVNAIAPVIQFGTKPNSRKTIGYWVLEDFEVN